LKIKFGTVPTEWYFMFFFPFLLLVPNFFSYIFFLISHTRMKPIIYDESQYESNVDFVLPVSRSRDHICYQRHLH